VGGFGWNFYGFFVFCFLWITGYFLWARSRQRAERKRQRPERGAGGEPGGAGPPSESERGWGPASAKKS
jgi:hypothetical protein